MSMDGVVNAAAWFDSMQRDKAWDDAWGGNGHQVLAVNLPLSFFYEDARVWGDMVSTPAAAIVRTLAWISTQSGMGTEYKVNDVVQRGYCAAAKPSTVQWLEELGAAIDPETTIGYRLWMVVLDHNLKIQDGFRQLITKNNEDEEDRKRMAAASRGGGVAHGAASGENQERAFRDAAGVVSGGMAAAPERRIMDDVTLANRVFALYLGHPVTNTGVTIDALYSSDVLRAGGTYDPITVLGEDNAFSTHTEHVCAAQCDPKNYRDISDPSLAQLGFRSFRGTFPPGVRFTRLLSQYFQPDFLCGAPLPHVARSHLGPHYQRFVERNEQLNVAKEILADVREDSPDDANAILRAEEALSEARSRVVHETDEMDDDFVAIRRSAPGAAVRGSLADSLNASYVDEVILRRNDLRKIHAAFSVRVRNQREQFLEAARARRGLVDGAAPQPRTGDSVLVQGLTFQEATVKLRSEMLSQFWRVFRTSTRVTSVIEAARSWYQKRSHTGKRVWARHFMCARNLSPFGNMVVRMTNDFGDTLAVETNFGLMWLSLLTVLGAHQFKFGLRPNLMVTGTHAAGKSYIVDQCKRITVPGAILSLTHLTTHALNGDDDISGCCIVMEEVPLEMIGVDRWGNTVAADPFLKNRLTSGFTTTLAQDRSSDQVASQRRARMYVSRCMASHIFLSNDPMPDKGSALLSRFIQHPMRKLMRTDVGGEDRTLALDLGADGEMDGIADETCESYQLVHFYMFLWESAIEAGAMPDIDMETARIAAKWIFDELATKHKVPRPSRRHVDMMLDYCRVLTMYYGVQMEFFSEYGYLQRARLSEHLRRTPAGTTESIPIPDPGPDADDDTRRAYDEKFAAAFNDADNIPFSPWMMEGLVKWGVVTQEIVVFVISLMEFLWVPKVRTDIALTLAKLAGGAIDDDGDWIPDEHGVDFRQEYEIMRPADQQQQQQVPEMPDAQPEDEGEAPPILRPPTSERAYDYRYVEIRGTNTREIAQKVQRMIPNPPSENDIIGALTSMSNDHIECKRKCFVDEEVDVADADGQVQKETRRVLRDLPLARDETIPTVIVETIPERFVTDGNHRRISLAVDVINQKFGPALRQAIKSALGHKFQKSSDFITAFPRKFVRRAGAGAGGGNQRGGVLNAGEDGGDGYGPVHAGRVEDGEIRRREDEYFAAGGPEGDVEEMFHNVFDTIRVKRNDNVQHDVANPYGRTGNEIRVLMRRRGARPAPEQVERFRRLQAPVFSVDNNIDNTSLLKYWRTQGVSKKSAMIAYAPRSSEVLLQIYEQYPGILGDIKETTCADYPRDWMEEIDKRRREAESAVRPVWGDLDGEDEDFMNEVYGQGDAEDEALFDAFIYGGQQDDQQQGESGDEAAIGHVGEQRRRPKRPAGCDDTSVPSAMLLEALTKAAEDTENRRKRARDK
jgi:hypothetical protein